MPDALLLDDNLMSSTRVMAQLELLGYRTRNARSIAAVPNDATFGAPQIVLINLGSRALHGVDLVSQSRAAFPGARILGFCGHLEVEIRQAAKAVGIDRIFTNDQAYGSLAECL
jgi:DNA-binding NarL/FixJ family response regulator